MPHLSKFLSDIWNLHLFLKNFSDFNENVKMSNNNGDSAPLRQPIIDSWCRTKDDEEVKFTFAWMIEKFSEYQE